MAQLTDIQAKILKKAKSTSSKAESAAPEGYVRRVADLEDPDEVRKVLVSLATSAAQYREPHERTWQESYRAWMMILDPQKKEDLWRSKRFIPLLFQHIESSHPALASAVFGGTKIWSVIGEGPDGRDHADAMGALLESQARGRTRMRKAYLRMLWWSLVCGTGVVDHQWERLEEERLRAIVEDDFDGAGRPIGEDGNPIDPATGAKPRKVKVMKMQKRIIYDDPLVRCINPFDIWLEPGSEAGIDGSYAFIVSRTTIGKILNAVEGKNTHLDKDAVAEWLEALEANNSSMDFDEDFNGSGLDMNMYNDLLEQVGFRSNNDTRDEEEGFHGGRQVTLLVYRGKYETFTLAPGGRIIGWSDNQNAHGRTGLLVHNLYEVPDCPYGRGLGSLLLPHQELTNENINRAMDVAEISLMAPVGVDRSRVSVLDDKFRWQPNALIRTRGDPKSAVTRLDMPTPTNEAMLWNEHFKKDADDTTGMTDQARGMTPAGINTATEFSGLQANIKTRTFTHVQRMNEMLELSAFLLIELNQQYMTQKRVISIIGENGLYYKEILPTDIVGDFQVTGQVSSSRMAPAMKIQQLISLTSVIVPIIQQVGSSPFLSKWVRMMLVEAEVEDVDRLIPKNSEKIRDPYSENVALRKGIKISPSPYERHDLHIAAHSEEYQKVMALVAEGLADQAELDRLAEHSEAHMILAQEAGSQMDGSQPPPAAPASGSAERQSATAEAGAAMGGNGVPGSSSPGPGAPSGRPM